MISTRSVVLVMDTVVCLTLAKWETVSGHFGGYLMSQLTQSFQAFAKDQVVPPPGTQKGPPKTVILPITAGENIPGMVNQMYKSMLDMQQQIKSLQEQVSTLQTNLQTQQANLGKLQAQFANHHHVVAVPVIPHPFRGAMFTTMNCPGIGQPCSLNSSSPGGSTYGAALWPPGSSPSDTAPPEPTATNVNTSGPQD